MNQKSCQKNSIGADRRLSVLVGTCRRLSGRVDAENKGSGMNWRYGEQR
jgi:hypothetical protein